MTIELLELKDEAWYGLRVDGHVIDEWGTEEGPEHVLNLLSEAGAVLYIGHSLVEPDTYYDAKGFEDEEKFQ